MSINPNSIIDHFVSIDDGRLKFKQAWDDIPESGQKSVATAGTAVAIGSDIKVGNLVVIANCDNSGNIYLGSSSVNSSKGVKIPPGGILPCGAVNLSKIYIDADVSGDGISYYYVR
ncbi:MAG: hypothetical protein A4E48_00302 [Methanosaeta sp. PtaU1.Bin060]|nr:MAG: hypothetical protein A4E48_00302 [Methanosaeta sp. PtaU1.Bin060]